MLRKEQLFLGLWHLNNLKRFWELCFILISFWISFCFAYSFSPLFVLFIFDDICNPEKKEKGSKLTWFKPHQHIPWKITAVSCKKWAYAERKWGAQRAENVLTYLLTTSISIIFVWHQKVFLALHRCAQRTWGGLLWHYFIKATLHLHLPNPDWSSSFDKLSV